MQQGDYNAPETIRRVCYVMFSKAMGRFLDTFYDDVFGYSHPGERTFVTSTSFLRRCGIMSSTWPTTKWS
jgi:hypothetical protein